MEETIVKEYLEGASISALLRKYPTLTRNKIDKVNFEWKNTKNYFKIEYRLIINTLKFLKK